MPHDARSSGRRPPRSVPSKAMRPERAGSSPMIDLSRVVLPTPFRTIRQTMLPSDTSSETSHRTWLSPYATLMPHTSSETSHRSWLSPKSTLRVLTSSMAGLRFRPAPAQVHLAHPLVPLHQVD